MEEKSMLSQFSSPSNLPPWLQLLLSEKFFIACIIHQESKKNEKNILCLDCCISICPHCLYPHSSHRLLQVRRYVYRDVIRLDDAQKLIDCASVQAYITNNAKVIFLNQRPQSKICKGSTNICITCERTLQHPFLFCSLCCKVGHILKTQGGLSKYLFECKFLPLPESGFDEVLMAPELVLEPASTRTNSDSGGGSEEIACRPLTSTATTEIVRKKRSSKSSYRAACLPEVSPVSEISVGRRKRNPQRSPLY